MKSRQSNYYSKNKEAIKLRLKINKDKMNNIPVETSSQFIWFLKIKRVNIMLLDIYPLYSYKRVWNKNIKSTLECVKILYNIKTM
tara:strand:+ start:4652 stop:4906 length:255 start_codon:yes stop_codon:yes gene_type:complete